MPSSRCRVCHQVDDPREEAIARHVTVVALVEGLESQEVRSRTSGRRGAPLLPPHSGGVVRECVDSAFADLERVGQYVQVGQGRGQFEVAVGDRAVRVGS